MTDEMKALIEKTRRIDGMWSKEQIAAHANRLADALEAATSPLPDEQLDEIEKRLAQFDREGHCSCYHESQERECHQHGDEHARFHGDVADDQRVLLAEVRGLRAEAQRIPLYAMLDIWQALYGTSRPEFDEFYAEYGYAETWARLLAEVRALSSHPDEETNIRATVWQEGWERGFRDTQAAGRDEDGYIVVIPAPNPYLPTPEGSET